MTMLGLITASREVIAGTSMVSQALAGATAITVEEVLDFSEDGGTLINQTKAETKTYSAINFDTNVITLTSGIAVNWDAEDRIEPVPAPPEREIELWLEGEEHEEEPEPIRARVPNILMDRVPLGTFTQEDGFWAEIDLVGGEWTLIDLPGDSIFVDGTFLDPDTVPPGPTSDGIPPASSPTPNVQGGPGWYSISWVPIVNVDPVTYEVHLSTTSGFATSASTKLGEINGTHIVARTMPDGSALRYDQTHFFRTVAKDEDGSAPQSAQASGVLVQANLIDLAIGNFDNLIQNPGFERGNQGWYAASGHENASVVNDPTNARSGNWCAKLAHRGESQFLLLNANNGVWGGPGIPGQPIDVVPDEWVYAEAWVKGVGANGTAYLQVVVVKKDGSGVVHSQPSTSTSDGTYRMLQTLTQIPTDGIKMFIRLQTANQTIGEWYFDDAQARRAVVSDLIVANAVLAKHVAAEQIDVTHLNTLELAAVKIFAPSMTGWRTEIGDAGAPIRYWDGETTRFYFDTQGNVVAVEMRAQELHAEDLITFHEPVVESIARVQQSSSWVSMSGLITDTPSNLSSSWPVATTAENYLIAVVVYTANTTAIGRQPNITPPAGWVLLAVILAAGHCIRVYGIANASSRSGAEVFAFTHNDSGGQFPDPTIDSAMVLHEYSGIAEITPLDRAGSQNGTSALATNVSHTIRQADELLFSVVMNVDTSGLATQSGPTESFVARGPDLSVLTAASGFLFRQRCYDKIVSSIATYDGPDVTLSNTDNWLTVHLTLKAQAEVAPIDAPAGTVQVFAEDNILKYVNENAIEHRLTEGWIALGPWGRINMEASLTDQSLSFPFVSATEQASPANNILMPYAGEVMAISFDANGNKTAGTATFKCEKNGVATGLTHVWANNVDSGYTLAAEGLVTFAEGDKLAVMVTTGSGYLPTNLEPSVMLWVRRT